MITAEATEVAVALVVGKDDDEVRLFGRRGRQAECEEEKGSDESRDFHG